MKLGKNHKQNAVYKAVVTDGHKKKNLWRYVDNLRNKSRYNNRKKFIPQIEKKRTVLEKKYGKCFKLSDKIKKSSY